jgi:hypothetical protein
MNRRNFIKKAGILSLAPLLLSTCEKIDIFSDIKQFDVSKGNHYYIGPQIPITLKNSLHFEAYLPDSQIHPPYDNQDCNGDWNKLFGAGAKLFEDHHENSARFVFRPLYEKDKIEIGHYTYYNGEVIKNKWTTEIDPNRYYEYEIKFEKGLANYFFEGKLVQKDPIGEENVIKRFLEPYNGGNCGAYRDTYVVLKEIE